MVGNPTASLFKRLISGENILMHVSKPKANSLNIDFDMFIYNCEFVWTFNACITVVVNRLTLVVFHKVMFCCKIHSGICMPKIIKIERDLRQLLR